VNDASFSGSMRIKLSEDIAAAFPSLSTIMWVCSQGFLSHGNAEMLMEVMSE
jgi:hypothetical protein